MKIEMINPADLTPYHRNPRINEKAIDIVAKSISLNGFNQPVVINKEGVICVGHTRWKASLKLGLKKIPVYRKEMSETEFIAYNLADNKTGEYASWDNELLKENLNILKDSDYSLLDTGFSEKELMQLLNVDAGDLSSSDEDEEIDGVVISGENHNQGVKQFILYFSSEQLQNILKMLDQLQGEFSTSNTSQTIYEVINAYYSIKAKS